MISSSAPVLLDDGNYECPASSVEKGDRVHNPLTGGSTEVSAVIHRHIELRRDGVLSASRFTPVRFSVGSIRDQFPRQPVWTSQNAVVLHPEKIESATYTRITAVRAVSLVGLRGIEIDDQISEIRLTKIVLAEPGLIYVCGLIIEAPALSVLSADASQMHDVAVKASQDRLHISRVH